MSDTAEKRSLIPQMTKFGKYTVLILLAFILIWPLTGGFYWAVYRGYTLIDPTRFPNLDPNMKALLQATTSESEPGQKGAALSESIRNRLEQEMNSVFGWSINDLIISPTRWLDNRANRQRGTIFATRMMTNFFSTNLAKYGKVDKENTNLKEAREKYFAFTSDSWWFPSSESMYEDGIAELIEYETALRDGNSDAVFNMRTDDMHNMLEFIIGKEFMDEPLGLLVQSDENVPYTEIDDHIYYTQGITLVVRDVLRTFVHLYPEIEEKGGKENILIAFKEMDEICTFDPLIVLRGKHDSIMADHRGKIARYLISIRERINDLAQSIKS
ncbi:MAG: DUF2333 family protein [Desulfobacterales bacterium]|nr:DUF2333 family protein [Desulfobacterales bacterium]